LLAFVEARKYSCDDHGTSDVVYRRSLDNGKTWGPISFLYEITHASMVVTGTSGYSNGESSVLIGNGGAYEFKTGDMVTLSTSGYVSEYGEFGQLRHTASADDVYYGRLDYHLQIDRGARRLSTKRPYWISIIHDNGIRLWPVPIDINGNCHDYPCFPVTVESLGEYGAQVTITGVDGKKKQLGAQEYWPSATSATMDANPLYEHDTQTIHVVFMHNFRTLFYTKSVDEGVTFSFPEVITDEAKKFPLDCNGQTTSDTYMGTGHAGGIVMKGGSHPGRLIMPMFVPTGSYVIYSDDHGASWHTGGCVHSIINGLGVGSEDTVAEVQPGVLVMNIRNDDTEHNGQGRLQTYSQDGGVTWDPAFTVKSLSEPKSGVEGSIVEHPNGYLYFSHPAGHILKKEMVIMVSTDMGRHWQRHKLIWKGDAAYSTMQVLGYQPNSPIGLLFERSAPKHVGHLGALGKSGIDFQPGEVSFTTFQP